MLINPKALKVANAAGGDSPATEGLHFEPAGSTVGTDGHILFRFTPKEKADPKEYPSLEGLTPVDGKEKLKPFAMSIGSARAILKVLPRDKRLSMPILKNIVLDVHQTNDSKHAALGFTDFKRAATFRPEKIENGKCPEYKKVIPKGQAKLAIGFQTSTMLKALSVLNSLDVKCFKLIFRGPMEACEIRAETENADGVVFGLVMPYNLNNGAKEPQAKPHKAETKSKPVKHKK